MQPAMLAPTTTTSKSCDRTVGGKNTARRRPAGCGALERRHGRYGTTTFPRHDGWELKLKVADEVEIEVEVEVEADETELEIELKWSHKPSGDGADTGAGDD